MDRTDLERQRARERAQLPQWIRRALSRVELLEAELRDERARHSFEESQLTILFPIVDGGAILSRPGEREVHLPPREATIAQRLALAWEEDPEGWTSTKEVDPGHAPPRQSERRKRRRHGSALDRLKARLGDLIESERGCVARVRLDPVVFVASEAIPAPRKPRRKRA